MKRDDVDLFLVPDRQVPTHIRLENWAMWVRPYYPAGICPMFRMAKSNSRQWHVPELRPTCDTKDAMLVEKTIRKLPEKHLAVIRWYYVTRTPELRIRKALGLTKQDLNAMVIDARQMVGNLLR
jgi:hypothetical protein